MKIIQRLGNVYSSQKFYFIGNEWLLITGLTCNALQWRRLTCLELEPLDSRYS